jgi:hypothetical protein
MGQRDIIPSLVVIFLLAGCASERVPVIGETSSVPAPPPPASTTPAPVATAPPAPAPVITPAPKPAPAATPAPYPSPPTAVYVPLGDSGAPILKPPLPRPAKAAPQPVAKPAPPQPSDATTAVPAANAPQAAPAASPALKEVSEKAAPKAKPPAAPPDPAHLDSFMDVPVKAGIAGLGVALILIVLAATFLRSAPMDVFQKRVASVVLALGSGCVAVLIPGTIEFGGSAGSGSGTAVAQAPSGSPFRLAGPLAVFMVVLAFFYPGFWRSLVNLVPKNKKDK